MPKLFNTTKKNKESNFKINCINSINLDENCLKTEISEKWI